MKAKRLKLVVRIELAIFVFILIFFAFLFSLRHILILNNNATISETGSSNEKVQYDKLKKYDEEFNQINSNISQIEEIRKGQLYWSNMFLGINQSILPGITLENVATKDYAVFLVGKADSRDNLIAFKDRLEKNDCFASVNLPLSNLVYKGSIDFQMDLNIKEDCVRNVK